jgi:general secretion pathway protein D
MTPGRTLLVLAAAGLLLAGCGTLDRLRDTPASATGGRVEPTALTLDESRLNSKFVRAGAEAMLRGDYIAASQTFSRALKFDPRNGALHFLNGFAYHLRALAGDAGQQDLAEVGYQLALQFNPTLYQASAHLGHLRLSQARYAEAQDAFAYALLFERNDTTLWLALAAASYFAQDLETATRAVKEAERLQPEAPAVLRVRAIVRAATGLVDEAAQDLARYRAAPGMDRFDADHLARRIEDWRDAHRRGLKIVLAQQTPGSQPSPFEPPPPLEPARPAEVPVGPPGTPAAPAGPPKPLRMALVDVVLIRSEERYMTSRGTNLLNNLAATFAYSDTTTRTRTLRQDRRDATTAPISSLTRIFSHAITIPQITYSLNSFNDKDDYNEVLARPSLVAVDGKPSDFFTGAVLHVQLQGAAGSVGAVETVPVGIKLTVTPQFIDDETVEVKVDAARAFIEGRQPQVGFNNFVQTTRTQVSASAVMRFGETLILSGLSEKETERIKDGVPVLKDIPIVQYLFSNETTLDFTKSVIILLTPRRARFTTRPEPAPADAPAPQRNLQELKGRLGEFKPAPNLDAAFHHLRSADLFKEFRTGDVRSERWVTPFSLETILRRTLKFLYY